MTKKFALTLFAATILIFSACQAPDRTTGNLVTVSIIPQKYFVERIAGDLVEIHVLIPPGAGPETYNLLPSQMKEITRSTAWFKIGYMGFEYALQQNLQQTNSQLKVFDLSEGIDLIAEEEVDHGDHKHIYGVDPHYWLSPNEVHIIAQNTYNALVTLFPEQEEIFQGNYRQLRNDIDTVDKLLTEATSDARIRSFLIFHPALTYLARQYGLEQIALEMQGKEPSPRHLRQLVELANEKQIKAIFIQQEFDQENAKSLAREIGAEVIQINPLDADWMGQMQETAQKLKQVLNP